MLFHNAVFAKSRLFFVKIRAGNAAMPFLYGNIGPHTDFQNEERDSMKMSLPLKTLPNGQSLYTS